jgi:DNA-binding NtrC family response regulator
MSLMAQDIPVPCKYEDPPDFLSILHVDDEATFLEVSKIYLERRGICVITAGSVQEAMHLIDACSFDVILSDYQMPGTDGIAFLKMLQERQCTIPFILFTGRLSEEVLVEAINNGAMFSLRKGGDTRTRFAELEQKIRIASQRHRAGETGKETLTALPDAL